VGVRLEISPEPSPAEREAIEAALSALAERDGFGPGAWWREGLEENLAPFCDPEFGRDGS
jgi:hypothetical protein